MFERFKSLKIATFGKLSAATLILITLISIATGLFWVNGIKQLSTQWHKYEQTVERKAALIALLRGAIGYGGLIHHVKNYVFRNDVSSLIKGHKTFLELEVILQAYRLAGLSLDEQRALLPIEVMLSHFYKALNQAEILVHQGLPSVEIDRAIKVDDSFAVLAFEKLEKELAKFRHANINILGDQVTSTSRLIFSSSIGLGVALIFLSLSYAWFIRTRIVAPLTNLVDVFDQIDPNKMSDHRLPTMRVHRPNEIDQLVLSGNRFLIAIEQHLKERLRIEEQVSAIVENTGEGIITIDSKGNIELFNSGAEKIFGYDAAEVRGGNVSILLPVEERKEHDQFLERSEIFAPRIINRSRDLEGRRKNGDYFPLELNVAPMVFEGERKFVGILRDISERKEQERNLINARDDAEAANLAKSEFLSSMSHELRTPMNAILGFGQLLQSNPGEKLSSRQMDYMGHILKSGDHLLDLINQVLELSIIESGKFTVSFEAFDVSDVMEESIAIIMKTAVENGIRLENLKDSLALPFVWADRSRVQQILLNLLSNAIKYNEKNGQVILDAEIIDEKQIQISVTDTGPGIAEEKYPQLFEPFNRLGREAGEIEGTGIGLTITKEIVDLLGGSIDFESKVGVGSTFKVTLQLADPGQLKDGKLELKDITSGDGIIAEGQRSILYIEDNPSNLRLMQEIIEQIPDLEMLSAHNAEIGLMVARENKVDMILLDLNLPGISGIDILKILRAQSDTTDIPVIAISATAMAQEIEIEMQAGFEAYITKPIRISKVLSAIKDNMK